MKRDPALTPLSRDHHQALTQALRLRRAEAADAAEVVDGMLEYWSAHGAHHFRVEEEVLLPPFARHHDPGDERVVRVLVDHVWIRERVGRLGPDSGPDELHELGERLDAHVRHEERVLFPLIESTLPADELERLAADIAAAEAEG
ncbi:MAG TPA: hemerythrin domain-containing protein [Solirubrobacterales bacterium]